jgi:hypothetical protein
MPLLIALPVFPINKNLTASPTDAYMIYIVEFKEKSLAMYNGSLADYPATSPSHTGKKLDFKRSNVVRYRQFLEQQKSNYLEKIKGKLERQVVVVQTYDVGFFGIAIRLKPEEVSKIRDIEGIKQIRPDELRILMNGPEPFK